MTLANFIGELRVKKLASLKRFDNEARVSQHIPFSHFVTPSIMATKHGDLAAVIQVQGIAFDVKDDDELDTLQKQLSFLIQSLHHDYAVYVTTHRHREPLQLQGNYPDGFPKEFANAYHHQFESAQLCVNDIYITLVWRDKTLQQKFILCSQ